MFEIVFLGTSASAPSARRGLSSQMILHEEYRFLVDCGEGTQRQIMQSGLGFRRLNHILITHGHLDHILGLAGLLSTFMRWETVESMEIFGGKGALDRIHDLLFGVVLRGIKPPMDIQLRCIQEGQIFDTEDFSISAFPVHHRGQDCFGYSFKEKSRRPFLPEKADALNIPPGPWRRDLVNGKEVTIPDGRKISPDQVLGSERPGTHLVLVGDAGRTEGLVEHCCMADALVIEATYLKDEAQMAVEYAHLTASQAAELAARGRVKNLILTHVSRRYRDRDVLAEARILFPETILARDFDGFQVTRGELQKFELP